MTVLDKLPVSELRPARWRDIRPITQLSQRSFGPDAWSYLDVLYLMMLPAHIAFQALVDGQMVGFAALERRKHHHMTWITTLVVAEGYRQHGIGSQLLKACEDASTSFPRIRLMVRIDNAPALALYRKFGYDELRQVPKYYAGGVDGLEMEKWLLT